MGGAEEWHSHSTDQMNAFGPGAEFLRVASPNPDSPHRPFGGALFGKRPRQINFRLPAPRLDPVSSTYVNGQRFRVRTGGSTPPPQACAPMRGAPPNSTLPPLRASTAMGFTLDRDRSAETLSAYPSIPDTHFFRSRGLVTPPPGSPRDGFPTGLRSPQGARRNALWTQCAPLRGPRLSSCATY